MGESRIDEMIEGEGLLSSPLYTSRVRHPDWQAYCDDIHLGPDVTRSHGRMGEGERERGVER